jgi:hypothetical protein
MKSCVVRLAFAATLVGVAGWSIPVAAAPAEEATSEDATSEAEEEPEPESKPATESKASVSAGSSGASASGTSSRSKRRRDRPEPAQMKNRVGFGAMRTIAGLNGLLLRWYATNRFTLGINAGVGTFSHRDTDENGEFTRIRTVGAFGVGPEFFFWPAQGDRSQQVHADFGIGLRLTTYIGFLGNLEEEQSNTLDTPLEVDIEIPAGLQLFIGPRIAVLPEFGVAFRIIPGNREPDQNGEFDMNPGRGIGSRRGTTDGPGFGFELGDHAGLFFGIGFAYFFGRLHE